MGRFNYYVKGTKELIKELDKLEDLFNADEIAKDCATETYNRTQRPIHEAPGGTPKDTGELIRSARMSGAGVGRYVVGYVKAYAPHVEYGHRLVAWGHDTGRFVPVDSGKGAQKWQ